MGDYPEGCSVLFGASGGLGQAIARRMAEMGADQVLTYRSRPEALDDVVTDIAASGRRVEAVACDTMDGAAVRDVLEAATQKYGRVHSVVSATGVAYEFHRLAEISPDAFREVMETDVFGFHNIARAAVPLMRASGGGSIVTLGTAAIDHTTQGNGLSCIPKAATAMMVRLLAAEEGRYGIRANMVGVGLYKAGMTLVMNERGGTGKITLDDFARQQIALRRAGKAEELAELVAFMASSRASYVTGQIVHADGGLSA